MAFKPLLDALAAEARPMRDAEAPISGPGNQLGKGSYELTITSVDMSDLEAQGAVRVDFTDMLSGGTHIQKLWPVDTDRNGLSRGFISFLNALFLRQEIYDAFGSAARDIGDQVFNLLRGMKLRGHIGPTPGYRIKIDSARYVVADAMRDVPLLADRFSTEDQARRAAEARGLKRSYTRVIKFEAISDGVTTANWEAFHLAWKALADARRAGVAFGTGASGPTSAAAAASDSLKPEPVAAEEAAPDAGAGTPPPVGR